MTAKPPQPPAQPPTHLPGHSPGAPEPSPARCSVDVVDATAQLAPDVIAWLRDAAGHAANVLRARGEVRVRVVEDAEMASLHEEFSGVPGTTDVLTFDLTDPEENQIPAPVTPESGGSGGESQWNLVDADVVVCLDEARRQASKRGYGFERELLLYVVHALLHCLGHDDHDEERAGLMHRTEDAVLRTIGVGEVYGVPDRDDEDQDGGRDGAGDRAPGPGR